MSTQRRSLIKLGAIALAIVAMLRRLAVVVPVNGSGIWLRIIAPRLPLGSVISLLPFLRAVIKRQQARWTVGFICIAACIADSLFVFALTTAMLYDSKGGLHAC